MDYGVFEEVDEKFITKYANTYGEDIYAYEIETIGFAVFILLNCFLTFFFGFH